MKLFLDCQHTLVHGMFSPSGPKAIHLMQQAVRKWAAEHPEDAIVVWTNSTLKDAAAVAHLCFPELTAVVMAPKDYTIPEDGDIVVDDESSVWSVPEEYPWLAKLTFYYPDDFTAAVLA